MRMTTRLDPVVQHHVDEMIERLATELVTGSNAVASRDCVGTVARLAGPANLAEFLPVLAYRFTRERLRSIDRRRHRLHSLERSIIAQRGPIS